MTLDGTNLSRETKFLGANGDREIFVFLIQLTMSRIDNVIRLIHTLLYVLTIHTCIHIPSKLYISHSGRPGSSEVPCNL